MSEINITIEGGTSKRLLTAGKFCDRDIVVTAEGGTGGMTVIEDSNPVSASVEAVIKWGEITFPNAVSIAEKAFIGALALTSIYLPAATSIGVHSFSGCISLASVNAQAAVTIENDAFRGCESLSNLVVPNVTTIGDGAFTRCTPLTCVDLPAATKIGSLAFENCVNLASIILRTTSTVCVVEIDAFVNTPLMTGQGHIYVPTAMYEYYRAGYEAALDALMPGFFDILFRKIEDYPEICGTT